MEIAVDGARAEQSLALAARFQLFEYRTDVLGHERLILLIRFSTLLELPLALEERSLVHVSEHLAQWNIRDHPRAKKRRLRYRDVRAHIRTVCVRGIAGNPGSAARLGRFSQSQLRVLADQIFFAIN